MTRDAPGPIFLERRTYRRRRMSDAARMLPLLGGGLFMLPLLWGGGDAEPVRTSTVMFYLFPVWLGLAVIAVLISRHLRRVPEEEAGREGQ
jgi:hypothetical protein